jgi:carbonic anhydrase/acetyltransferase-like protein (isoleucine patch superfamily)
MIVAIKYKQKLRIPYPPAFLRHALIASFGAVYFSEQPCVRTHMSRVHARNNEASKSSQFYLMPIILPVKGVSPQIPEDCFIAPNATIAGDVRMGAQCSVWFNAVIRGDVNSIRMGDKVNVQDGACIHCTYQKAATTIGNNVSIGHHAIVHGCTINDNVLIGMGAIIMDHVHIGNGSIIAAGAVVLEGTEVAPGSIYAGVPAKKVKNVSPELLSGEIDRIANNYVMYSSWFRENE